MPTVSARTHQAGASSPELSVHRGFELRPVDVVDDGVLRAEWHDVIAARDLLLASGHLSAAETVVLFREARRRGVSRLVATAIRAVWALDPTAARRTPRPARSRPAARSAHWARERSGQAHPQPGLTRPLCGAAAEPSADRWRVRPD
jgi:Family of unknown function (DUF6282)